MRLEKNPCFACVSKYTTTCTKITCFYYPANHNLCLWILNWATYMSTFSKIISRKIYSPISRANKPHIIFIYSFCALTKNSSMWKVQVCLNVYDIKPVSNFIFYSCWIDRKRIGKRTTCSDKLCGKVFSPNQMSTFTLSPIIYRSKIFSSYPTRINRSQSGTQMSSGITLWWICLNARIL